MRDLQKWGGLAALVEAALYVAGFGLFLTVLDGAGYDGLQGQIQFLLDHQHALFLAYLFIYILFGLVLVVLVLALHDRLSGYSRSLMRVASAFGLLWAGLVIASGMIANVGAARVVDLYSVHPEEAQSLWLAVSTLQEALGGGNEIVGGLWLALLSLVMVTKQASQQALGYLGLAVGAAGILTVVPGLGVLMDVFGLGQIVWFLWVGVVLLR